MTRRRHATLRRPRLAELLLPVLFTFLAGAARAEPAAEPESPPTRSAADVLPEALRAGPHHRVEDTVGAAYGLDRFRVTTPNGTYDVLSRRLLEIRVREIETMATVVGMDGAPEFLRSLGQSLAALPTGAVELVTHPGRSFAKVGRGLGKTWNRLGDAFRSRPRSVYEDPSAANVFQGDEKRKLAAELGLDVYSTNPRLQAFLNQIASARAGGNLSVDLASFALPVVGYVAVTTSKWRADAQRLLRDHTPIELDRINAHIWMDLGVSRARWLPFFRQRWLSPRHRTVITAAAKEMRGALNLGALAEAATTAQSEVGALMQEQQATRLAHHHATVEPLARLERVQYLVVARTKGGAHLAYVPLDLVAWDTGTAALATALRDAMPGAARLHVVGRVTPRARSELEALGFEVLDRIDAQADSAPASDGR